MTLWVNEGNMVMDACLKGQADKAPRFISGTLTSIDYGKSRMTLSIMRGEQGFILRPENRMFRDIAVGTRVTIEVNDIGPQGKAGALARGVGERFSTAFWCGEC